MEILGILIATVLVMAASAVIGVGLILGFSTWPNAFDVDEYLVDEQDELNLK
jgi:hypothetical protein